MVWKKNILFFFVNGPIYTFLRSFFNEWKLCASDAEIGIFFLKIRYVDV